MNKVRLVGGAWLAAALIFCLTSAEAQTTRPVPETTSATLPANQIGADFGALDPAALGQPVPVPEPLTPALLGLGGLLVFLAYRRRR